MAAGYDNEYVEFVTPRLPALRRLAYLLSGDWHYADDLVQATMVKLYVRWRRARAADDIEPYVRAMLVKQFLTEKRRKWSQVVLTADAIEPTARRPATTDVQRRRRGRNRKAAPSTAAHRGSRRDRSRDGARGGRRTDRSHHVPGRQPEQRGGIPQRDAVGSRTAHRM